MSKDVEEKILYRDYQNGDEDRIVDLFNAVFARNDSISRWNWAYRQNVSRNVYIKLAFCNSMLIGQSASMPLLFNYKGNTLKAARIQDAMVHKDFRRRGVSINTLKKLMSSFNNEGIDFAFAFPQDYTFPLFKDKFDYRHVGEINMYFLPTKSLKTNYGGGPAVNISENINFEQSDADFINSQLSGFNIFNVRSVDYLNWRYHKNSGSNYSVVRVFDKSKQVGFAVCKLFVDTMSIDLMELFILPDEKVITTTLNSVYGYYGKAGLFSIWLMEHYPLYENLVKAGFYKADLIWHLVCKEISQRCSGIYNSISSYYLSMGDSDVY